MYLLESMEIISEQTRLGQLGDLFLKKMACILSMGMKNLEDNLREIDE